MRVTNVPSGPSALQLFLHLPSIWRNPPAYFKTWRQEYGDVVRIGAGPIRFYIVSDPRLVEEILVRQQRHFVRAGRTGWMRDLLGQGLLTSNEQDRLRHRRTLQRGFTNDHVLTLSDDIVQEALVTASKWRKLHTVNMYEEMSELVLRASAKSLFGWELGRQSVTMNRELGLLANSWTLSIPYLGVLHRIFARKYTKRIMRARAYVDAEIHRLITAHKNSRRSPHNVLSIMLQDKGASGHSGNLTDQEIRDEIITLLVAGRETTASALTWAWYELSRHPGVRAEISVELESVLEGSPPSATNLLLLRVTKSLVAETLRLYPPAWTMCRMAEDQHLTGDYLIPAGAVVLLSQYVVHRDARYYDQVDNFDPQRWLDGRVARLPSFSYFPFGGGSHACIGEHFAWTSSILILATLLQRFNAEPLGVNPPVFKVGINLNTSDGMPMRLLPT